MSEWVILGLIIMAGLVSMAALGLSAFVVSGYISRFEEARMGELDEYVSFDPVPADRHTQSSAKSAETAGI